MPTNDTARLIEDIGQAAQRLADAVHRLEGARVGTALAGRAPWSVSSERFEADLARVLLGLGLTFVANAEIARGAAGAGAMSVEAFVSSWTTRINNHLASAI